MSPEHRQTTIWTIVGTVVPILIAFATLTAWTQKTLDSKVDIAAFERMRDQTMTVLSAKAEHSLVESMRERAEAAELRLATMEAKQAATELRQTADETVMRSNSAQYEALAEKVGAASNQLAGIATTLDLIRQDVRRR